MKLSVVIVNYNVRAYLEQCLRTVFTALDGLNGEVFVVDNQSTDGSVELVREKFPNVRLIANTENVGFSRANNQAIRKAKGEYVLLLNPDTVVGEDVFHKVVAFMDAHPKAGGLGVKMIDGTGHFLPESKRGLPTPQVAFFKIIGLSRLFPKSSLFGRYHLGHLPENEAAPIEILSGACMFLRKRTLDEVGLLDESFFMYGEDIDLSYRITLGGYENWYYPDARIIHYKGESTKKSSVNYVFVFYNAMAIFAQKHFARSGGVFPVLIKSSIYLSAAAAIATRFLNRALLPFLDLLTIVLVLALSPVVPQRWPFIQELGTDLLIGLGVVGWTALFGGYDRPLRFTPPVKALMGLLIIGGGLLWSLSGTTDDILETALLCTWATAAMLLVRLVLHLLRIKGYGLRRKERERVLAIGSNQEAKQALALLWQTHFGLGWTSTVRPGSPETTPEALARIIRKHRIGEVVFCAKDLSWGGIITLMEKLRNGGAEFKIAQPAREFIIGPSSIESLADLYVLQEHALITPAGRRAKRILDVMVSLTILLLAPFVALLLPNGGRRLSEAVNVLTGKRSWVGYLSTSRSAPRLPTLRRGIFDLYPDQGPALTERAAVRMNALYAKDYDPFHDLRVVWRGLRTVS
ncbi:MAG: glycosyltransferase [Flavobacteriales bacterium]|nr:glycosyltransferase [Flavobacteriales bacterium]